MFGLQGLTLDSEYNFTAGVEAVEFGADEAINLKNIFQKDEWIAKWCLCNQLAVPMYVVTYKSGENFISIYEISLCRKHDSLDIEIAPYKKLEPKNFADWWSELKGTKQTKPLYEAGPRISLFDRLLEKQGLAWGGNIDGFILGSHMKPLVIIETRYTQKIPLEDYDPAVFYPPHYTRAGDYKTWEPMVLLASKLSTPLFLFTFERESDEERIGFAVINSISERELEYQGGPPNKNIVQGIENIKHQIMRNLQRKPPTRL
jgi:hypothetical protein